MNQVVFSYTNLGYVSAYWHTAPGASAALGGAIAVDSQGNRTGSGVTFSTSNQASNQNYSGGNTTSLGDNSSGYYDAWGRLVYRWTTYSVNTVDSNYTSHTATYTVSETYTYDALGRLITDYGSGNPTVTTVYDQFNHPIQASSTAATLSYFWSGSDGRLIARSSTSGQFLYALTDEQNNVTALVEYANFAGQTSASWQVVQRISYDSDGYITVCDASWNRTATPLINDWTILWHSQIARPLSGADTLYTSLTGSNLYDSAQARYLTPSIANTYSYDPQDSDPWYVFSPIVSHPVIATAVAGVVATVATGGYLGFASVGAVTAAAAAEDAVIAGAAGGLVGGFSGSYSSGASGGQVVASTIVGGVAGALSGAAGVWGASVGKAAFLSAGWSCGVGAGLGGGVVGGATFGLIQGGYNGLQQTGTFGGTLVGAGEGALVGGLIGGVVGAGIGALSGQTCFIAGTQVVINIRPARSATELMSSAHVVSVAAKAVYLTVSIETIKEGDKVFGRRENDPFGPLEAFVVEKVFRRITYHLRILTIRMSDGRTQIIYTTNEHPAYKDGEGWTNAGELQVGDQVKEAGDSMATIIATRYEAHPDGVQVFNLRIAQAHTYLVRANGFDGEPIWVHNQCDEAYLNMMERLAADARTGEGVNPYLDGQIPQAGTRATGVNRAIALEVKLVQETGSGTIDWTPEEIQYITETGELPRGIVGHHINSVVPNSEWAGDPRNIQFVRGQSENLDAHGGNFQNPTVGPLIDRAAMIQAEGGL